jgi:ubiquinone/menaquinone biosynthesis C-methylase UbiE
MRALPFADASFDLIVSRAAIHNVYDSAERDRVVAEIVRVLKPGGQALINDIRHGSQYRRTFERLGCRVESFADPIETLAAVLLSFGSIKPAKLQAVKI